MRARRLIKECFKGVWELVWGLTGVPPPMKAHTKKRIYNGQQRFIYINKSHTSSQEFKRSAQIEKRATHISCALLLRVAHLEGELGIKLKVGQGVLGLILKYGFGVRLGMGF